MQASDEQLTNLLNYCIDFAREMLERHGEFHPFGAEVDGAGELRAVGFFNGDEKPSGQEAYSFAHAALTSKAKQGGVLAYALAANVDIPPQFDSEYSDGIRVHLESEGFSRFIYAPYVVSQAGLLGRKRTVRFADMFAVEITQSIFS